MLTELDITEIVSFETAGKIQYIHRLIVIPFKSKFIDVLQNSLVISQYNKRLKNICPKHFG
jgi:hypothetical protein